MIPMTVSLQASRSLVSAHSSVSVQFVMALMSSSHRARGLPLFLAPPPIPNIIDFSKLFSLRMMCPKYDSCCFFICASSGLVGLISSITDPAEGYGIKYEGSFLEKSQSGCVQNLCHFVCLHHFWA